MPSTLIKNPFTHAPFAWFGRRPNHRHCDALSLSYSWEPGVGTGQGYGFKLTLIKANLCHKPVHMIGPRGIQVKLPLGIAHNDLDNRKSKPRALAAAIDPGKPGGQFCQLILWDNRPPFDARMIVLPITSTSTGASSGPCFRPFSTRLRT